MDAELACFVHGVLDKLPSGSAADALANAAAAPPAAAAPAAAAEASAAQLQGTPWSEVEKKIAAMDSEGGSALGAEETAAIETYGQNALVGRELELFGRRPLDQPLLVSVCKQCSRPILTAHFAAHRENCVAPAPPVAPAPKRPASQPRLKLSRPGPPAPKRQAIEARRPIPFVRTRDVAPVTEQGAAPVPALCPPEQQKFPFQLGRSATEWHSYHSAQQARLYQGGDITSGRSLGAGCPQLVGIVAGIGSSSISQYGHLWIPPEQPLGGSRARATPRGGQGEAQASPVGDPRQSAVLQRLFAPAFTDQLAMIPGSQFLTTRQGDTPSEPVRLQISGQRR